MVTRVWVEYPRGTIPREWPAEKVHVEGNTITLDNLPHVPEGTPEAEQPFVRVMYEVEQIDPVANVTLRQIVHERVAGDNQFLLPTPTLQAALAQVADDRTDKRARLAKLRKQIAGLQWELHQALDAADAVLGELRADGDSE